MSRAGMIEVPRGVCWWCRLRAADSREHKFKRSDLVREHGRGELKDERTLVRVGGKARGEMRSTKSGGLKFQASLCASCNNARSQPIDQAYDRFIAHYLANEDAIIDDRQLDLQLALGADWDAEALDVLRFFVKHASCRIVEATPADSPILVPRDAIGFLDGGQAPESLTCEFWVEPTWLRFCDQGDDDPLWVRPLGFTALWRRTDGRAGSQWRHGGLTFGWELGGPGEPKHPFRERMMSVPIQATMPVDLELAFANDLHRMSGDPTWLERVNDGEIIDPAHVLAGSAIGQSFVGGALDFEASLRNRAPDMPRQPMISDPPADPAIEEERAVWLARIAREARVLRPDQFRSVEIAEDDRNPVSLAQLIEALRRVDPTPGFDDLGRTFAGMATAQLVLAVLEADADTRAEQCLETARYSGMSLAAVKSANIDAQDLWEGLNAAVGAMVRLAKV